jgi:hypothetical protein
MSIQDVTDGIVDKVVIGTIAAVVSLLVLHGYNSNLKAFESAQPLARSMSDVAVKKKDALLLSIKELISIANGLIYKLPKFSSSDQDAAIRSHIADIATNRNMLGASFSETSICFGDVENKFETKIHGNYDSQSKVLNLNATDFGAFLKEITASQDKCIELFNKELADLLSRQYREIYASFYKGASWYERPESLLAAAVACVGLALLYSLVAKGIARSDNSAFD